MQEAKTYFYGDESQRLHAAQELFTEFGATLAVDPGMARTLLIARMQIALREAYSQGRAEPRNEEVSREP